MINFPVSVFISLGSNLGDREQNLRSAIDVITKLEHSRLEKISSFYSTAAWGKTDQPDFLNAVIAIQTLQSPEMLMKNLLRLENEMGRKRDDRWGPRLIDMDILFYGDKICRMESLIIPHPELHKRRFVLVPLNEIAPGFIHPVSEKKVFEMLDECPDELAVIISSPKASHA